MALRNYDENELKDLVDEWVHKTNNRKSDEFQSMHNIERTIERYERYLVKIMRNYDQTYDVSDFLYKENTELLTRNEALKKMAREQGIDVENLLLEKKGDMSEVVFERKLSEKKPEINIRDQEEYNAMR